MIRLVLLLVVLAAIAFGAAWLADRPGEMVVVWQGWRLETTVPVALAALAAFSLVLLILAKLISLIVNSPRLIATFSRRRRREKGWQALSRGLLAIGAGDGARARSARDEAARLLPHEPLTHLLAAQSAQFDGNGNLAAKSFRQMLEAPETRVIALRGLYMEARRAGEGESARAFAEEAAREAPALGWAADAAIEARSADGDYAGAREILERQMAARGIDRTAYRRRRAVLLAAEAIALEVADPAVARERATESVRLAPSLVPAAAVAGRLLGASGDLKRAAKILSAAFAATPHPDLAEAYAHLRPGDAAQDRLKRIRILAGTAPTHPESIIALAHAAIDAQEFQQARAILSPLTEKPTQRICLLMAELEAREHGDVGKAREWAARAVRAPRDPAWIADGVVSDQWAAISPVTGRLDAYAWEVPPGVTATPVLEHEAERVRNAIAAIPAPEAVLPKAEPAPDVAATDAPASASPASASPASAADGSPAEPAKPAGLNGAGPGISARQSPAAAPIIAEPPRPDDPGPLAADEDISIPRKP